MLKRIYVDNYKCLVNFETGLDQLNLFLGGNGTGKTTVFQVLQALQAFITDSARLNQLFPTSCLTRWQTSPVQQFSFSVQDKTDTYTYELALEHDDRGQSRVTKETVRLGDQPLFLFEMGTVHLFLDDFSPGSSFSFDWQMSGLNTITERHDNKHLTRFKAAVAQWVIVEVDARSMTDTCVGEDSRPAPNMANFTAWLRFLSQEHQDLYLELVQELKELLPDFISFRFVSVGEDVKSLRLLFGKQKLECRFSELSDGQRSLIALETLLHCLPNTALLIDEPENFLALPEIQPWIAALQDRCEDGQLQAVIISHHPQYIDFLAANNGIWFERNQNTPARVRRIDPAEENGVAMSELIARGWLRE